MKKYIVLFSTQDEWGIEKTESENTIKALEAVYGSQLEGQIEVSSIGKFLWDDDAGNYFTGIIVPEENLTERVYIYKHDSEELLGFKGMLECYKKIACSLEEAYGLEEAKEVVDFLIKNKDATLNINLGNWGDTTIFIMD